MIINDIEYKPYKTVLISRGGIVRALRMKNKIRNGFNTNGYQFVQVTEDNKRITYGIHRLVWLAWKGLIPEGKEINHIDCNKQNNNLDNLQLVTKAQNTAHAKLNNRYKTGVRDVHRLLAVKELIKLSWNQANIAKAFDISASAVSSLLKKYK